MRIRNILRKATLSLVICALALALTACGGKQSPVVSFQSSDRSGGKPQNGVPPPIQAATGESVNEVIAKLAEYPCPEGVDGELWAELKDALAVSLATNNSQKPTTAHYASAPPDGDDNLPWDVQVSADAAEVSATWRGRHRGDYDLSGAVAIADITPLAMHYGEEVQYADGVPVEDGENEYLAVVDGDDSGDVGISDITPIAIHYGETCSGYRLYLGLQATGETEITWAENFLTPPGNPEASVTVPFQDSRIEGEVQRYDFSFDPPEGFEGQAALRIAATDGETDGAVYETEPFPLNTIPDTEPPYHVSGIEGLAAESGNRSVTLTWGEWHDDRNPPVIIELAWGPAPLADPNDAPHSHTMDAGAREYVAADLDNEVEYEFTCRFADSANPPNYTAWLESALATPTGILYRMPPAGTEQASSGNGISPSLAAFNPDDQPPSALYEDFAPALAYIAVNGATDRPLMFARYSSGWQVSTVSPGDFASCSLAILDGAPAIAAVNSATGEIELHSADMELTDWEMEPVHTAAPSVLKLLIQRDSEGVAERICVIFATGSSPANLHVASRDVSGGAWNVDTSPDISDSVFSFDAVSRPGNAAVDALVAHGTATPEEMALDTTLQHLSLDLVSGHWAVHDYALPPDSDDDRHPLSVSLRTDSAPYLLAATGAVRYSTSLPYEIPYGDVLASEPTDFSGAPDWIEAQGGTTGLNLIPPLSITLDWATYPVWTGEILARMIFVKLEGELEVSLNPLEITGGTVSAEWRDAWTKGGAWLVSPLEGDPPGGLAQSPAPTGNGAQMAYVQIDSVDIEELLGGTAPEGSIYYWREESCPLP